MDLELDVVEYVCVVCVLIKIISFFFMCICDYVLVFGI